MTNLPSPTEIVHFIEVAQAKNVSRAAERLGITQPSLSISLKKIESKLGLQLLTRSKVGVQLTPAGKRFQLQAQVLLDEWKKMRSEAINDQTIPAGEFTIGAHPSVALYTLHSFLPELLNEHPGLKFNFVHEHSRKITEQVISYNIDYGLVVNPVSHGDLVIQEICRDSVGLWTSKKPSRLQTPGSDVSTLLADQGLIQSQDVIKKLRRKKFNFNRVFHSSNLEVITGLVYNKIGVGILPERVAKRYGQLELVPLKGSPVFEDRICLIYRADRPRLAAHKAVVDAIKRAKI